MHVRYLRILQVGAIALFTAATAAAQSRFTLSVQTGRGANGYDVNSTLNDRINTYFPAPAQAK